LSISKECFLCEERSPLYYCKKTNIFDAGMVVFLNAINVYTKQKKCILQFVVQSLTLEFRFYCGVISLVPWNMSDFFRAQKVTGSGRCRQFCMSGTFACPNQI